MRYSASERLKFINKFLDIHGTINRKDIAEKFGVTILTATMDLAEYKRINPDRLRYNLKLKRYECRRNRQPKITVMIEIDGPQGSGKTTIAKALADFLTGHGFFNVIHRTEHKTEGGDTVTAERKVSA